MTCKELARRLEGTGVTSLVAHPGLAVTDHFGKSDSENKLSSKLIETYANSPIGQSSEGGAIPLEFACTAAELEGTALRPHDEFGTPAPVLSVLCCHEAQLGMVCFLI